MQTVKQILASGTLSREFYVETNVWHKLAVRAFFLPMYSMRACSRDIGVIIEILDKNKELVSLIRERELGGYSWQLCNMDVSSEDKYAACAYLFSQCLKVLDAGQYHEGFPPERPKISDEERREKFLKSMRETAAKDAEAKKIRDEQIANGDIILPEKGRPYELWLKDGSNVKRIKTYRSHNALYQAIPFNIKEGQDYATSCCDGEDETSRHWFN